MHAPPPPPWCWGVPGDAWIGTLPRRLPAHGSERLSGWKWRDIVRHAVIGWEWRGPAQRDEALLVGQSVVVMAAPPSSSCLSGCLQSLTETLAPPGGHLCWCWWKPEWGSRRSRQHLGRPRHCCRPPRGLRRGPAAGSRAAWRGRTPSLSGWSWPCFCRGRRRGGPLPPPPAGSCRGTSTVTEGEAFMRRMNTGVNRSAPHLLEGFDLLTAFRRLALEHVAVVWFGWGGELWERRAAATIWTHTHTHTHKKRPSWFHTNTLAALPATTL